MGRFFSRRLRWQTTGRLRPLINQAKFGVAEIGAAQALMESAALGKVVVEL
jgi:NADPH:quinone reductase-like Zn-dependent oxidoreductase